MMKDFIQNMTVIKKMKKMTLWRKKEFKKAQLKRNQRDSQRRSLKLKPKLKNNINI